MSLHDAVMEDALQLDDRTRYQSTLALLYLLAPPRSRR